jgi:hypothetical protein
MFWMLDLSLDVFFPRLPFLVPNNLDRFFMLKQQKNISFSTNLSRASFLKKERFVSRLCLTPYYVFKLNFIYLSALAAYFT